MATRSRTQLYMKMRDSLRTHKRGPRSSLELKDFKVHKNLLAAPSDDEGSTIDARVYTVPPKWVTLVSDLNSDISSIRIKLSELQTMSGKALLPGFGDDEEDTETQITQTVAEVSSLFKEAQMKLKTMGTQRGDTSQGDEEVRENIQRRVAKQLQELETEFRKGHKTYVAKLKGQTIEEYRPDLSLSKRAPSAGASSFFEDEPKECVDPRFSAQQTLQLVMMDQMSAERERQINQVAESVNDLADIFKEIQVLVIDQGTVLDRIDYNIEQAAGKIGEAEVELRKANDYQKKSKTMLCIYLLLLLCGAMVIVLLLKKSLR
ncbi:hypothetical protein AB1Y20_010987 [Prymnesium parvum]|uniref:t-SNARE coiled-coil homology domain-containing protein n=1 Tax=Prymnesium parvum TaxID=97485 RepID=A0AB34IP39_PRYPA|mmetsp:Transcript_16342/g.39166  ORF Transcript_16342/g.39166 Transcript_16342/m.39166 type:complete len:319 (+) Transcript_16342:281-1237(+)